MSVTELLKSRYSCYDIGKNSDIKVKDLASLLAVIAPTFPSAYNSQTSRIIVLDEEKNTSLWDLIDKGAALENPELYEKVMSERIGKAKEGLGTILFFEDRDSVEDKMPTTPERQNAYKEQNSAMATVIVWLILTELELGASLQHFNIGYNEGKDESIRQLLNLPDSYELMALMPFGSIEGTKAAKPSLAGNDLVQYYE